MYDGARVAVIVPAFNEERLIARTLSGIPSYVDQVFVVDDASSDRTSQIAAELGGARTTVLRHDENRGVGAAIATGYSAARAAGAEVLAVMAGDAQMHPDDLAALVAPVARGDVDYAKGDRLAHPDVWRRMPKARLVAGIVLGWLTCKAAGLASLEDSQCGFTAISARAVARVPLAELWPRYGYPNDLLGHLALAGLRIRDVVVRPVYADERSGLRFWHVLTIAWLIARVAWRRFRAPALRVAARETAGRA